MRTLVWFRGKDLRLADHGPLRVALRSGDVLPLFVVDPYFFAPERARQWPHRIQFLLDSLLALQAEIARRGSRLLVVAGKSTEVVPRCVDQWKVDQVVAHRWVEPVGRKRDRRIQEALGERFVLFEGETLMPPGTLRTAAGGPYAVFSQFARAFRKAMAIETPLTAPEALPPLPADVQGGTDPIPTLESLGLRRNPRLLEGGEVPAKQRLERFLHRAADSYAFQRDRLDLAGTSRLSADLKFGTLSVREVWTAVSAAHGGREGGDAFLNELLWREFAHSTLWDRPEVLEKPFRPAFEGFPWVDDDTAWEAWVNGKTGYPVVDAAARQLLAEGFVHNRARMIAASFLTKHLLIHYKKGEAHYMKYLTDGDWAQNNAGWQWSAGCGCDAQPYFRVFNPVLQGEKFDPEGAYVRTWVPELAGLPPSVIHRPWEATELERKWAGVRLGETYPRPILDAAFGRDRFLGLAAKHMHRSSGRVPSTA